MANMKSLAKDTAVYGLSSIVGRCLNYLLVPIYTAKMAAGDGGYGIITNVYAVTALILVLLTFGMETTFFRFATKAGERPERVFSTAFIAVAGVSALFVLLVLLALTPLSTFMGYGDHRQYVWVMAVAVAADAMRAMPFAYLRQQKKALKFAGLQLFNIVLTIILNLVYYVALDGHDPGYAFYINCLCSIVLLCCVYKEIANVRFGFSLPLFRRMLVYAWPIAVLGIAGILNQVADKILFPYIYKAPDAQMQLGIYGACVKIAMIMAMITQAFRYAYEPFVFNNSRTGERSADQRQSENDRMQAQAMKYFLIFTLLAFLCVAGWIDVLRYIIGRDYWEGLQVVPIVMAAEIMMGIYFNLSFWYKLEDKTGWGAIFSGIGCAVLLAVNFIFVPVYGYRACAWAGFAGYATAMTLSYVVGQHYHPIDYPVRDLLQYVGVALVLYLCMTVARHSLPFWGALLLNTLLILLFTALIVKKDFPLSSLPLIGKRFK